LLNEYDRYVYDVHLQTDWNDGKLLTALMTSLGAAVVNDDVSPSNRIQVIQRGASRCRKCNTISTVRSLLTIE